MKIDCARPPRTVFSSLDGRVNQLSILEKRSISRLGRNRKFVAEELVVTSKSIFFNFWNILEMGVAILLGAVAEKIVSVRQQ